MTDKPRQRPQVVVYVVFAFDTVSKARLDLCAFSTLDEATAYMLWNALFNAESVTELLEKATDVEVETLDFDYQMIPLGVNADQAKQLAAMFPEGWSQ